MEDRDGIMVAANDKRGTGDMMQLFQGYMGLIKIQVRDLELPFDLGGWLLLLEPGISV